MSLEDLERRIGVLEDIEEIKKLKRRYCAYCAYCDDNYDADAIAELFTVDAVWDGGMRGRSDGREEIRSFFKRAPSEAALRYPHGDEPHHRSQRRIGQRDLVLVSALYLG